MFRALPLMLIGLATPLVAQEPGLGIVGDGTQTQSVELLNGNVSVTLESSGSVSLGRGEDNVGGGLNLSVNDTTILGASRDGGGSPAGSTPQPSNGNGESAGGISSVTSSPNGVPGTSAGSVANGGAATASIDGENGASAGSSSCMHVESGREQLIGALTSGQEVWMRPTGCAQGRSDTADLALQYPQLQEAVVASGKRFEDVVAITISDDFVILDMANNE